MQKIHALDVLEEVLAICPPAVLELMQHLMESMTPDHTQTRYIEIGPMKWWLKNILRCPILSSLFLGGRLSSHYALSGVSMRITSLPIYSKTTGTQGLRFLELRCHLSLITPYSMCTSGAYLECKHYSRNSGVIEAEHENSGGTLVSFQKRFHE